jgi:hypothetical protein
MKILWLSNCYIQYNIYAPYWYKGYLRLGMLLRSGIALLCLLVYHVVPTQSTLNPTTLFAPHFDLEGTLLEAEVQAVRWKPRTM